MDTSSEEILTEALALPPIERVSIIDQLLSSIDMPDGMIDSTWKEEVAKRIDAYQKGHIKSIPLNEVLSEYTQ